MWINLPSDEKMGKPKYQQLSQDKFEYIELEGFKFKIISGELTFDNKVYKSPLVMKREIL